MESRIGVSASGTPRPRPRETGGSRQCLLLQHVPAKLTARETLRFPSLVAQTSRVQSGSPVPVPRSHPSHVPYRPAPSGSLTGTGPLDRTREGVSGQRLIR